MKQTSWCAIIVAGMFSLVATATAVGNEPAWQYNSSESHIPRTNWAGAISDFPVRPFDGNLKDDHLKNVTARFTVPQLSAPGNNSSREYGLAIWVGFGGGNVYPAALNAGVIVTLNSTSGEMSAKPVVEYAPVYVSEFYDEEVKVNIGDEIELAVSTTGPSTGFARIENLSTGAAVVDALRGYAATRPLSPFSAAWIVTPVEDKPIPRFEDVVFENAVAITEWDEVIKAGVWNRDKRLHPNYPGPMKTTIEEGRVVVQYVE